MDDCTEDAFCNGRNATCPNPDPKPDNVTECNQGTQVCSTDRSRVSVHGVKSQGFEFYEVKKRNLVIIFQKENGNTFKFLIIFTVKSLQKEQNSTNLLL